MTQQINHMPSSSVTVSMFISETVYRIVKLFEHLVQRVSK